MRVYWIGDGSVGVALIQPSFERIGLRPLYQRVAVATVAPWGGVGVVNGHPVALMLYQHPPMVR